MRQIICIAIAFCSYFALHAQAEIVEQNFSTSGINKISFNFHWSDIIFEPTSGDQVEFSASVEINGGEHNDHFQIASKTTNGTLYISTDVVNMDDIPKRVTLTHKDKKYVLKKDKDYKKKLKALKEELGIKDFRYYNNGVDMDLTLTIKVPKGIKMERN